MKIPSAIMASVHAGLPRPELVYLSVIGAPSLAEAVAHLLQATIIGCPRLLFRLKAYHQHAQCCRHDHAQQHDANSVANDVNHA
jgi:hypothetical protein